MKILATFNLIHYISKVCNKLILLSCILILIPTANFSQAETDKLLQCTWEDSVQSVLNRKENIVVKINYGKDYKEWRKYSDIILVAEGTQNGNLIVSNNKNKNIRIPISGIESIQNIKIKAKKKSNLPIIGGILGTLGLIIVALGVRPVFQGKDLLDTSSRSCSAIAIGMIAMLLGLILLLFGWGINSGFKKLGREISLIDPKCKCEWFERP
ncbi:MAG: hypothetical protein IPH93_12640 [Saprospiraceae bacterium]|nr:hypothetical protein [Saprospiraceae bacterium]